MGGQVGAERTADLDGPDRPAGGGAAAEPLEHLSQGDPEGGLDDPAARDVAGQLEHLGAPRPADAEVAVERGTRPRGPVGHVARDSTLLTTVGWPKSPSIAGNGGFARTMPRLPSRLSSIAVSSPQM